MTPLGKTVVVLFVLACVGFGLFWVLRPVAQQIAAAMQGGSSTAAATAPAPVAGTAPVAGAAPASALGPPTPTGPMVTIGVAYGTEKREWMEWSVTAFAATPAGAGITVKLIPMGSQQGAQAVVAGDTSIHAWAPASSVARDALSVEWQVKRTGDPIASGESLALTPMALVWWQDRHDAFVTKYGGDDLAAISKGLKEPTGWAGIANKPEWGLFKFGHTDPTLSNSGLMALITMAYDYHQKDRGLVMADILNAGFQSWLSGLAATASGTRNESTGTMMREMILKGPSVYDCLLVYESVAIAHLANAEGRWGRLAITYPRRNFWNDNPYYVLDVPWSTPAQRAAATTFRAFLLSTPAQQAVLERGFRPADPAVPVLTPGSPFQRGQAYGVRNDIGSIAENPSGDVVMNLVQSWQRARASR
jgi:hypothetical protein